MGYHMIKQTIVSVRNIFKYIYIDMYRYILVQGFPLKKIQIMTNEVCLITTTGRHVLLLNAYSSDPIIRRQLRVCIVPSPWICYANLNRVGRRSLP